MKTWADLNHIQTGRYGEYFAKMAFARAGFDVFSPVVDDKGIDFVLRIDGDPPCYYDVQVKTIRSRNTYVFMRKDKFRLTPNLLLALVILDAGNGRRLPDDRSGSAPPRQRRGPVRRGQAPGHGGPSGRSRRHRRGGRADLA